MSVLEFVESIIYLQLNCHQVFYVFLQGKAKTAIKAISMPKFSNREDGRTICLICVKDFVDLSTARRHYREKHEERNELFECSYCNQRFTIKRSLSDHMFRKHKISQKMLKNSVQWWKIQVQKAKIPSCSVSCSLPKPKKNNFLRPKYFFTEVKFKMLFLILTVTCIFHPHDLIYVSDNFFDLALTWYSIFSDQFACSANTTIYAWVSYRVFCWNHLCQTNMTCIELTVCYASR